VWCENTGILRTVTAGDLNEIAESDVKKSKRVHWINPYHASSAPLVLFRFYSQMQLPLWMGKEEQGERRVENGAVILYKCVWFW